MVQCNSLAEVLNALRIAARSERLLVVRERAGNSTVSFDLFLHAVVGQRRRHSARRALLVLVAIALSLGAVGMSAVIFDPLRQPLTEHAFVPRGNFAIAYPRGWHLRMRSDQTITAISARRRDTEQSTLNRPSQDRGVQIRLEHQPPSVWLNRVFPGGLPYSAPVGSGAFSMLTEYMLRGNLHVRAAGAYLGMLEPMQIGRVYGLGADADADADMFHLRGPTSHGWIDGYVVTRGAQVLLAYVHAPSLRSLHGVDRTWHAVVASIDSTAQRRSALE